jgi:hypothetical protein
MKAQELFSKNARLNGAMPDRSSLFLMPLTTDEEIADFLTSTGIGVQIKTQLHDSWLMKPSTYYFLLIRTMVKYPLPGKATRIEGEIFCTI